ncbi:MAG: N-acetyl-gamma-glutamyl-phosphate reductase [Clostridia bacterium]|nr:N-acetyl-gamma-glutamyl-phosphate reductase [Clostridia bacterium]
MKKVFIDGGAGTTGLRIVERLSGREDICLLSIAEEKRKDNAAKKAIMNEADVVFLCLPDGAAVESAQLVDNPNTVVIDASTAHRTLPDWAYGFPELGAGFLEKVKNSKRIAVPGCHASGFIALVYPLIEAGILDKDALISCHSLTGYSGGGKNMIAEYEDEHRSHLLDAPMQYGLGQQHKHLKEMKAICGLANAPLFSPIVGDFYSGMLVSVPLFAKQISGTIEDIKQVYKRKYTDELVYFSETEGDGKSGFAAAVALERKDSMRIAVYGNEERILLTAAYDNLGKGASGAAIECMNIALGLPKTKGLEL